MAPRSRHAHRAAPVRRGLGAPSADRVRRGALHAVAAAALAAAVGVLPTAVADPGRWSPVDAAPTHPRADAADRGELREPVTDRVPGLRVPVAAGARSDATATATPRPTDSPSPSGEPRVPRPTATPSKPAEPDDTDPTSPPGGPGAGTVGVPAGTRLERHDGDLTITRDGTVVDGLDVRGFVRVRARDVVIRNSVVRGPATPLTAPMSLVQADAGPGADLLIQDSTIYAQAPSRFVDGIVGMGFTLDRVDVHTVVDQVKVIGDEVLVTGSHLHDNLHYPASGSHEETHDDNVQVAVGAHVRVLGSTLEDAGNAAVMITQDRGPVRGFTFRDNRADDGACTVNVAEKSYGPPQGLTVTDNVFGTGQRHARCAVIMSDASASAATVERNVHTDGSPVRVSPGA